MNNNPLVSIITPCYNGAGFISRFLDSILQQTYSNIEIIVVDDGSRDDTLKIMESYRSKFDKRGFSFIVIHQENGGQSAAINRGLEIFKGEYITWPDSDDYFSDDAIECKVDFMENNPQYGMCICKTQSFDDATGKWLDILQRIPPKENDCLFIDLILGSNVYYSPGGYMVRSSMFREVMPIPLQIATPRVIGQNYQLMLPIAYKFPCGYIDKVLYYYAVRSDSHSHEKKSFEYMIKIPVTAQSVISEIVNSLDASDDEKDSIMKTYGKYKEARPYIYVYEQNGCLDESVKNVVWRLKHKNTDRMIRLITSIKDNFLCKFVYENRNTNTTVIY